MNQRPEDAVAATLCDKPDVSEKVLVLRPDHQRTCPDEAMSTSIDPSPLAD